MSNIPTWWPEKPALYDIDKSYEQNFAEGPFFDAEIPARIKAPKEQWIDFLGHRVASPLGVPAGPLLNEKWVTLAARLGFDMPVYKTMRSQQHTGHPHPNVMYVETKGALTKDRFNEKLEKAKEKPEKMADLAITNSFGMPSMDENFLMEDIERANNNMEDGQVMIVSVVGTPREGEDFTTDFAKVAAMAKEAGAKIIEANFSCPNVATGEGSIYMNPETVFEIASAMVKEIGDTPLIIKVGYFADQELMKEVFVNAARAGVRAICGINTIGMEVVDEKGKPALGENRLKSGICGEPIQKAALEYTQLAAELNDQEKLGLKLMTTGGATLPEHFDVFLQNGADVAMSATGMMWDPFLALRWHEKYAK